MTALDLPPTQRTSVTRNTARHRGMSSLTHWPFDPAVRWLLRLLLALPYLLVAVASNAGPSPSASGNRELLDRISTLSADLSGVAGFDAIYPPASTAVGLILAPFGTLGLAVLASIVAGFLLQKFMEVLIQRGTPVWAVIAMTLVLAANPLFAFLVTTNLPVVLALAAFGLGATHMMRFVVWGATSYGFRAGLCFLLALFCHQSALLFVAAAAMSAPFVHWHRTGQPGARRASIFVLVFPSLFGIVALFLLQVAFSSNHLGAIAERIFSGVADNLAYLLGLFTQFQGAILWGPALAVIGIAGILRRPGLAVIAIAQLIAVGTAFTFGLVTLTSTGITFVFTTLLVMVMQPRPTTRLQAALLTVAGAVLIAIAWSAAFSRVPTIAWMDTVLQGVGVLVG